VIGADHHYQTIYWNNPESLIPITEDGRVQTQIQGPRIPEDGQQAPYIFSFESKMLREKQWFQIRF
jgi:hypothetical protein